jgi:hypothetical protein
VFGDIHRVASRFDKPFEVKAVFEFREADADRDILKSSLLNGRANPFGNGQPLVDRRADEKNGEFIATVARGRVNRTALEAQDGSHAAQGLASGKVSVPVVDEFEAVEIHQQNGK